MRPTISPRAAEYRQHYILKHGAPPKDRAFLAAAMVCFDIQSRVSSNNKRIKANYADRGIGIADCYCGQAGQLAFARTFAPTWVPGLEIDRIDNSQGYVPGNLWWETHAGNMVNRRNSLWIETPDGERLHCKTMAVERLGLTYSTLIQRIKNGHVTWPCLSQGSGGRGGSNKFRCRCEEGGYRSCVYRGDRYNQVLVESSRTTSGLVAEVEAAGQRI